MRGCKQEPGDRNRIRRFSHLFLAFVAGLAAVPATANDGAYDPSFASGGRGLFALTGNDSGLRLRILPDGTLMIAGTCSIPGNLCVAWLRPDGSDFSHNYGPGGAGKVILSNLDNPPPLGMVLLDMAVFSDGRVVLIGQYVGSCGVAVLKADGSDLDRSVAGGNGWVTGNFGLDSCNAVAVQGDGKVLLAGSVQGSNVNKDFAVARWLADLSGADPGFNDGKPQTVAFEAGGSNDDSADTVLLQPDGKILLGGAANSAGGSIGEIARLLPDGRPDNSVNSPGAGFGPLKGRPRQLRAFECHHQRIAR